MRASAATESPIFAVLLYLCSTEIEAPFGVWREMEGVGDLLMQGNPKTCPTFPLSDKHQTKIRASVHLLSMPLAD